MRRRRGIVRLFDDVPALDVAELELVAVFEDAWPGDRLAHHLGAVLAFQIFDGGNTALDRDARVAARHARIVDAHGGAGLAADAVDAVREDVSAMTNTKGANHASMVPKQNAKFALC